MADLPTSVEDTSHVEEKTVHQKRLPTEEERDILVNATIDGDMEVVTRLSNDGVDMDAIIHEEYQQTPLHGTAAYGYDNIVKKLISLHVNIECVDVKNSTPLHIACQGGYEPIVKTLLLYNADIECRTDDNCTPVYIAAMKGHNEVVKLLLQSNADVNCVCKAEATPLHVAAAVGHLMVVKTLLAYNAKVDCVNGNNETPLQCAVRTEKSDVVKYLVEHGKIDIKQFDQNCQEQILGLLQFEAVLERSKTEVHTESSQLGMHSGAATHKSTTIPKSIFPRSLSSYATNMTLEEVNEGYMDGTLPIVDPRVVLLGCEGSGKTSLIDTFVGNSFQNTPATEGADQMEISVTTAANWELMNEKQKIYDLQKQTLLESEFFLSIRECCRSLDIPRSISQPSGTAASFQPQQPDPVQRSIAAVTPALPTSSKSSEIPPSSANREAMAQPHKSAHANLGRHHAHNSRKERLVYITKEEFQELKAMTEKYDPKKKYIHLWDFAGQQIFQHTHGLFVSEEVVCLIVFNAGRSLYEVPGRRYANDVTPAKSTIKVICYWMELISSRISRRSTDGDDLSILLPTFILVGTHIDELDPDIEKAAELAFQIIVPALIKELASKPFARHIAGSKNNKLFAKGSSSIFFVSNKNEMRNPVVINKLKRTVMNAASITRKVRPIRYVKMERKLMLLAYREKMCVIDKSLAREVAESCGIACTDKQLVSMLHHFHQKGILLHFHNVSALSSMIILSPQWLAKLLTYVLTTLKCRPIGPPLALFMEKLEKTGLLEQELLDWSVLQFSKDEIARGNKMLDLPGLSVAELLINFKLMVDVSNTSLVGRKPRGPGKHLFLVPHLLPAERLAYSTVFGYYFFYYFPAKFIPEHLVDQLIVKCAEWNGTKQYDMLKLTYQWVCLELGKRQIYELEPEFDHHIISLKIIPEPYLLPVEKERAFVDSNELVRSVQKFIDDLMRQHMTATFMKAPVVCYIPCSQCMKMHLKVDKATESSTIYCPVNRVHADITDYHKILTAQPLKQRDEDPTNIVSLALNKLQQSQTDQNLSTTQEQLLKKANPSESLPVESVAQHLSLSGPSLQSTSTLSPRSITEQVPKMKLLHNIVVPKISSEWKIVADFLELEFSIIDVVEERCKDDPVKCCEEMLREWLKTDHGLQPKTWSTLITALKVIKKLPTVSQEVEQELKSEILTSSQPSDCNNSFQQLSAIGSDNHTGNNEPQTKEISNEHEPHLEHSKMNADSDSGTVRAAETIEKVLFPHVFDALSHSPSDTTQPPARGELALKPTAGQSIRSLTTINPLAENDITEQEPKMKQLHEHVIPNVAAQWRKVAEFLEFKMSAIDLIEEKYRSDPTRCCEEIFRKWLKTADCGVGPKTWSTLIESLKGIKRFKSVAEELHHELNKQSGDHEQTAAANNLVESSILEQKPKMKHLNNIVVPKIAAKWKRFADSLEFESGVINTIDVKCMRSPEECCEEIFRDWLSLDHGIGPRTWSTLLKVLKETRGCEAATEQIENEVKSLQS